MFTVVTHNTPDLDAITAVWLIKRFLPNWQDTQVKFVPAGQTLEGAIVDSDPHTLHVDTGFGLLDHHQTDDFTCASKKVYAYLLEHVSRDGSWKDEALERMCEVVNFFDHFREANLPDAGADYHMFSAVGIIDGLKVHFSDEDHKLLEFGFIMLGGLYKLFQERLWAEEILDTAGVRFDSKWGKAIAFETLNDAVLKLAQKTGYVVAVRKDPKKGYVRIKGLPNTKVDFSASYKKLQRMDPQASWFLHASKKMLLNGTTKNPDMKPTTLSLEDIINVLRQHPEIT